MSEFYTSDVRDLLRCQQSMAEQKPITVIGGVDNEIKTFTGVVQAIDEDHGSKRTRWLVAILDLE
jgi:hypothetical protein